ncbi:MAG: 23S rRNA (uracil(1939)-C(5))-methyltransferase RlmD [Clostridia bacterium]|nr:23S rRNA (uracil(1939)-C(5))-methyltransferase RlmD [Clostridia bacterium]
MNNLGYGVCRADGAVCFVAGGVTGDELEIRIIKVARDYLVGRIEKINLPSPHRAERVCPLSKRCGGCSFDGVDPAYELEIKRGIVASAFRREGIDAEVGAVVSDGRVYGYRNKVAYPVENGAVGYYGCHTHDILDCGGSCPLASPLIDPISAYVAGEIKRSPVPSLRHIYIRAGEGTGEAAVCFVSRKNDPGAYLPLADRLCARFPEVKSVTLNVNPAETNVILGKEYISLCGKDSIEDLLCGLRFTVSPASFWQVNRPMAELLYKAAAQKADLKPGERLLDLFCGTGSVGLCMAANLPGVELTGVEIVPEAVENARANAALNGIADARFICADANSTDIGEYDVIVVDPPRKGLAPELIDRIAASGNQRLVYISCNPATLARDCKLFISHGYAIGEATPFDLFPRTGHVESVALITRARVVTTG